MTLTAPTCTSMVNKASESVRLGAFTITQVDQIAKGIYRISSYFPQQRLSFNQFLIADEQPALIHTGAYPQYADIRQAVAQILDSARLAYIIVPHFEADECGGMGRFVAEAPNAVLVCSAVGARINVSQWDYAGPCGECKRVICLRWGSISCASWKPPTFTTGIP